MYPQYADASGGALALVPPRPRGAARVGGGARFTHILRLLLFLKRRGQRQHGDAASDVHAEHGDGDVHWTLAFFAGREQRARL